MSRFKLFSCMDSNHDQLSQSQLCYRCTTGKYFMPIGMCANILKHSRF
jgi:hypothetical protein